MVEFHELVGRIERAIAADGAVITCPDYVNDAVTGEPREVDASIRRRKGMPPVRVLECRDRAPIEDVTWIEQLATKCRDHGVPTVALSSAEFSRPAAAKASRYGIETRLISEVTQDEMIAWVRNKELTRLVYFPVLGALSLKTYCQPGEGGGKFHPSVIEQLQARKGDAPVFVRRADGRAFTARELLDVAVQNGLPLFHRVPDDGSKVRKQVVLDVAPGVFQVRTAAGPRDVGKLTLGVNVRARKLPFPFRDKGFCYYGSGRPATYGAEIGAELGAALLVSVQGDADAEMLTATLADRDGGAVNGKMRHGRHGTAAAMVSARHARQR